MKMKLNASHNHHEDEEVMKWDLCKGAESVDYIPCLDNRDAIKQLKSRRHMEHRERHCPEPTPKCLVPLPDNYKPPVPWPKSRDMLVEYKKEQNWVKKEGEFLVFPGGGTQFKYGVTHYVEFIEKALPVIKWGKNIRVVLDVGCGVASFGGFLLDKDVIYDLTFPTNAFDLIHCARCRVHWDADGGKPLLELNRVLRPGGFFIWSATPVYRDNDRDSKIWTGCMVSLTKSICWKVVAKTVDSSGIGLVIYQKPTSESCYKKRNTQEPPLCVKEEVNASWYAPLRQCISKLPSGGVQTWPELWPKRLVSVKPKSGLVDVETFKKDTEKWSEIVSDVYLERLAVNWSSVRNVMDMNAGFGGFAAALVNRPLWVMNVVPVDKPDTLSVVFDRGLIGVYHDWCESLNTYPRTYDLLHSSFLLGRCHTKV
ncbi:putative methyltransferase PMT23 [Raphanus sativus]|nr:putative methyltransferase PMT23 [Raphanus sativus]